MGGSEMTPEETRPLGSPAIGTISALPRAQRWRRLMVLIVLLGVALSVREADLLHPTPDGASNLPPLPGAAEVEPGIVRGGEPGDLDLIRLRDYFSVRSVVQLDREDPEERAVAEGLGLAILQLAIPEGEAPTAEQMLAVVAVARAAEAARSVDPHHDVYIHDAR
jgi:hypothetical protein